ncbi:MAG TPA: hypothetical protein VNS09_07735 [Solirubrobacter sp.]|nr:hypothetical protein [Solirubrobacter sp.]
MRVLDELEREIERIATAAGDVRPRRRWWRSGLLLGLVPLCAATVAVAATTGILSGEPVKNPPDLHLSPKRGLGVLVGPGQLLDVRAQDPAGGPPWALRMVKTSRGLGCVQIGRLVDGTLGVLGQDGAFADDGRFHERGAEILQQTDCQQADGAGHVFIALSAVGLPASGDALGCKPRPIDDDHRPLCPPGSLRTIFYGLLGPDAVAVTYRDADGAVVREPVKGPEGAYLVVRGLEPTRRNVGYFVPSATPASGLRTVEYRDGTTCQVGTRPRHAGCPLKGFVAPKLETVTREQLATPVRLHVGTRREHLGDVEHAPAQRKVTVTFRARVAADTRSFYTVRWETRPHGLRCGPIGFGPITKDVTAGAVLDYTIYVPYRCAGRVEVKVGYSQQRRPGQMPFDVGGLGNAKVGTAVARLR